MQAFEWSPARRIRELLAGCIDSGQPMPPEANAVYLVTRSSWQNAPTPNAEPLYFGGNTGQSARFRTRIGDLIADMHGFYGAATGHHSGGQSLHAWCLTHREPPGDLYLAWATRRPWCGRCAEVELAAILAPDWEHRGSLLNKHRPGRCPIHLDR